MTKLICPDCGREEAEPYDVGDKCYCGSRFMDKTQFLDEIFKIDSCTMVFNGGNPLIGCPKSYDEANKWADNANSGKIDLHEPKWSFDCGFKLDFDGPILDVSSRFYPPKTHYGPMWDGTITILLFGEEVAEEHFEYSTLDQLKEEVEKFVTEIGLKIGEKMRGAD